MAKIKISIESARANAKLLQQDVALKMHIARETYGKYERGETAMSVEQAILFAEIVKLPLSFIDFSLPKNSAKSDISREVKLTNDQN